MVRVRLITSPTLSSHGRWVQACERLFDGALAPGPDRDFMSRRRRCREERVEERAHDPKRLNGLLRPVHTRDVWSVELQEVSPRPGRTTVALGLRAYSAG
jgi:hypothetical protein